MDDLRENITPEEKAAFVALCPNARLVRIEPFDHDTKLAVAVEFDDGLKHALRETDDSVRIERGHMLRLAAFRMKAWHEWKVKADG